MAEIKKLMKKLDKKNKREWRLYYLVNIICLCLIYCTGLIVLLKQI